MVTKSKADLEEEKKTDRKAYGTMLAIGLVAVGVISYFFFPFAQVWLSRVLTGGKGLVYLLGGGILLEAWFLIIGYRGKALLYALGILVFTILCIWLAINFDLVWDAMVGTIGLWPTILIVFLGALGLWFTIKTLL